MKLYRFSPIKNEDEMIEVINYLHITCNELCFKILGKYFPLAGNIGIFSHYDYEYDLLKGIQEKMTLKPDKFNDKYLILMKPIKIFNKRGLENGSYEYLYIRKMDPYRHHVGDVDFYVKNEEYEKLKLVVETGEVRGARYLDRLDMIELFHPDFDVLVYISPLMWLDRVATKNID